MSNPFAAFRKNQKAWMAATVLLAILAFVVAPAIQTATSAIGGGNSENATVVSWNGGSIKVADLRNASEKHASLVRFMGSIAKEVVDAGGRPNVPGFGFNPQTNQIVGLGIQSSSNDVDICRTRILATQARKMGIEFSDETIDDFIRSYTDGKVSTERVAELLSESTNDRLSWFEAKELLKEELAALVVSQIARAGVYTQAPGKTYRDFLKLTQTAKVEAFPVFVDDYMDKVTGSPSEAEIQAIYDAGKNRPANPSSPEPGFVSRYKTNVQYIEANLQQWIKREQEKLTDEVLRAEYDRRVGLGQLQVVVEANAEESPNQEGAEAGSEETTTTEPGDDAAPADMEAPAETAATEPATESTTEPTTEETPAEETPAEETPGGDKPDSSDQSSVPTATTRLVAFVQDQGAVNAPKPPPVTQPPQLGEQPAATANDSPATGDSPATSDSAVTNNATATGGAPAVSAPGLSIPGLNLPNITAPDTGEPEREMRTQTFAEAKEQIAESLARDAAIPALDDALTELLEDVMRPYYGSHRQYQAFMDSGLDKDEEGQPRVKPKAPNLKAEAEKRGLIFRETGLIDGTSLAQTPFGLGNVRPDESGISGSVANIAMNPGLELYRPLQSSYFDQAALMAGNAPEFLQYLFWKTEEQAAFVPELEDIRGEVADAWKRQKARLLAEDAAAKLSKQVSAGSAPWETALSTAEKALIVETEPFSWMSRFGEFTMTTNVPKLDAVGPQFMERVFATPAGQVSVAPNSNQSVYYVARVVEFGPPEDELQMRFNADSLKSGPLGIAREESDRMVIDWYQNLEQELGVLWEMNMGQ